MNIYQAVRCSADMMIQTAPDAKGHIFIDFRCRVSCEFRSMCLKIRKVAESKLNGGLK